MPDATDPRTLPGWDQLSRERQIDCLVEWAVYERRIVSLVEMWSQTQANDVGYIRHHTTDWTTLPTLLERMAQIGWTWYSITPTFCQFAHPISNRLGDAVEHNKPLMAVCLAALRALGVEA